MRQYVNGLRTDTTAVTAAASWSIYRWGWQFSGSQQLSQAYVAVLRRSATLGDDAIVARWSANPLGMLWPEMDAAFVSSGGNGGGPAAVGRPVDAIAAG